MAGSKRSRIYLAGPEVFLPDAAAAGAAKVAMCRDHGFEGLFPLDASVDLSGVSGWAAAQRIALANEGLMRSADALIANLTPFRGASTDCGTAFEVGFMRALGRPVLGYSNCASEYASRAKAMRELPKLPFDCDRPDVEIEDFGLAENLMIAVAISQCGGEPVTANIDGPLRISSLEGFEVCLARLRTMLG